MEQFRVARPLGCQLVGATTMVPGETPIVSKPESRLLPRNVWKPQRILPRHGILCPLRRSLTFGGTLPHPEILNPLLRKTSDKPTFEDRSTVNE